MRLARSPAVGRAGWTLADQGVSSLTNLGLSVLVATSVDRAEFGAFALVFAGFSVALGLSRSISSDVLGVRFSAAERESWATASAAAGGTALCIGVCCAAISLAVAALTSSPLRGGFLALACVLPGVLLQDVWRFAFFAAGRPAQAVLNDTVYLAALVLTGVALAATDVAEYWPFVVAWGGAATVAAMAGSWQSSVRPDIRRAPRWIAAHRGLTPSFLGEFAIATGLAHVITFGVAAVAGLAAAGALRGAQVIFGPVNVALMAAVAVAVPEGARLRDHSPAALRQGMVCVSALVAGGALAWGLVAWRLLPGDAGRAVLGATWDQAEPVLPALAALMAVSGSAAGAVAGLRVLERPHASLAVRSLIAPLVLIGGIAGAHLAGARGAVWGQVIPLAAGSVLWWWQLRSQLSASRQRATSHSRPTERSLP